MESGKIQRQLPGKLEEADRNETRRRRSGRSRAAQEAGPGGGPDGRSETEPGTNGRQEEAGRNSWQRCASRGSQITPTVRRAASGSRLPASALKVRSGLRASAFGLQHLS